jgi:hypothetical protein
MTAWAISQIVPGLRQRLDVNRDGSVNLDDLVALFSPDSPCTEQQEGTQSFIQQCMHALWSQLEYKFVMLSIEVQKRERVGKSRWRTLLP